MYRDLDFCDKPGEKDVLWRYMDFTKFVDMLEKESLFFSRLDLLADKFEGALPQGDVFPEKLLASAPEADGKRLAEWLNSTTRSTAKNIRRAVFVNCWHRNKHESAAMWGLYLKSDEGIAIKSSFSRLKKGMQAALEDIYVSKIKYIDYKNSMIRNVDAVYPALHKRLSFSHEREVRAFLVDPTEFQYINEPDHVNPKRGINITADLHSLIGDVYVSPVSADWFRDLVNSVLHRYGVKREAKRSSLSDDAIW